MIVEVTVSNIVVDQAAVTHGSKHVSTGTDPIPLGTTSAAGVVQLATTGVEAATKVPKATGADLAALLTAGGYTLTAPSGANSLDGIADTATWKKVAAAVATALNAGTYDAASVSVAGIGKNTLTAKNEDLNGINIGGRYIVTYNALYHFPSAVGSGIHILDVFASASDYTVQEMQVVSGTSVSRGIYRRQNLGGTWTDWSVIFTTETDGNGGRPPAPRPSSTSVAGYITSISPDEGLGYSLPSGGTWMYSLYGFTTANAYSGAVNGVASGGTLVATATAGVRWRGWAWRVIA